ncbi:MAG: TetR/AcrR family transcriptional regulator [Sulfuricella sp.]|nr:TetR/AcrR family transcriptional regulator [Sulfuricella sp.]
MTDDVPQPPRWQRRAESRPQEVLEAALAVFVERGYTAASLDEVARRAGVSKGTLYLYFDNKAELFKAVIRQSLVSNMDEARTLAAQHSGDNWELLTLVLREFTHKVVMSPLSGIPKLILGEAGNFPEITRFYFDEVVQRGRTLIQGILERGIAAGEFRAVDTEEAWRIVIAPLVLSMLWKHTFQPFEPQGLDFERHLRTHLDLLRHGLASAASHQE